LLEKDGRRLLVDCGLFQGYKALRLRNWSPLPVQPSSIDAVLLTHAHVDHSGYLPLLKKQGFRGPIYCTRATRDLCGILLPDCGHLQERDAEYANRRGFSRHNPALPLFTEEEAAKVLADMKVVEFGQPIALPGGATVQFFYAGHILGAASLLLRWDEVSAAFSGDIGRYNDPLMFDPCPPGRADYLVMESTYGDRRHGSIGAQDALAEIIGDTLRRGGTIVVPAFAVGRAQSLLFHLGQLKASHRLSVDTPIYLDSPMAIDATEILLRHQSDQKLSPAQLRQLGGGVHYVHSGDESARLTEDPRPKIIISASGMATGGRVLNHLERYAPDEKSTILFTGFQAGGTRGAALTGGADTIKMHGRHVPVRAEVRSLSMMSAHADKDELLRWANEFGGPTRQAFIVHGEPSAADSLRQTLEEKLHWSCTVPDHAQEVTLA
jgi:metallo-beta-lactamase family protein